MLKKLKIRVYGGAIMFSYCIQLAHSCTHRTQILVWYSEPLKKERNALYYGEVTYPIRTPKERNALYYGDVTCPIGHRNVMPYITGSNLPYIGFLNFLTKKRA
jgi:hypothetical protein